MRAAHLTSSQFLQKISIFAKVAGSWARCVERDEVRLGTAVPRSSNGCTIREQPTVPHQAVGKAEFQAVLHLRGQSAESVPVQWAAPTTTGVIAAVDLHHGPQRLGTTDRGYGAGHDSVGNPYL